MILIVEVHSCSKRLSFSDTIRKLILGLADLLRYYSNFDPTVTSSQGLVIPKFDKKCVVKVTVEFKDFMFDYTLQVVAKDKFRETLLSVFDENRAKIEKLELYPIENFKFYIKLPMAAMETFGRDCKQMTAKEAIMFKADDYYYKVPVSVSDARNLMVWEIIQEKKIFQNNLNDFVNLIEVPEICAYKYLAVKHYPLSAREARRLGGPCLQHLSSANKIA